MVKVAIKLMAKQTINRVFTSNGQAFSELEVIQECSLAGCPNILEFIEAFEDSQYLYIVTKFMPAGDLLNYLMKQPIQPLPESHAKKIIRDVAKGLQSLHDRLIIHRDIKIENILMTDFTVDATPRIADLGSAVKLRTSTDTVTFKIGTPGYIAPEVILGKPYGLACDIWSMGCLMHVLLTASPPFWEDDRTVRNARVCNEQFDSSGNHYIARLSLPAKNLLVSMLHKDPA